jgi:hypothetical protein
MTNPADARIAKLIDKLADEATRITTSAEDRQQYINQIAQLRASMNVAVVSTEEILDRR